MTTGATNFFSGAAGATVSPGNGVTPFGTIFGALELSGVAPNNLCHKLGFGAGSGTGNSCTGCSAPLGEVTIFGAGATCTTCTGAAGAACTGAGATGAGFGVVCACGDCAGRVTGRLEFFVCGFGSVIVATTGGFDFTTGATGVATATGAEVCSKLCTKELTSSQCAGLGVSARYARKFSSAVLLSCKNC